MPKTLPIGGSGTNSRFPFYLRTILSGIVDIIDKGILRVEQVALPLLLHTPPEQVCVAEPGEVLLRIDLSEDDSVYYHVWVFLIISATIILLVFKIWKEDPW